MMDLLATVPYYTAYLSRALRNHPVDLTVGSISYYLDPDCFSSREVRLNPGLLNVIGKIHLPRLPRRILKLMEGILNLCALTARFSISPPDVVHVQYLPMLKTRVPLDLWFMKFCQWRGAKIVLTVHDLLPHDSGDEYRAAFLEIYRRVDAIICHSDSVRARLASEFFVPYKKVSIIQHGPFFYDLPATNNDKSCVFEPGKTLVLWQGIIFPYKGIDVLLRAWQLVEEKNNDACLVIAGTGAPELLQEIRAQVEMYGLKRVKLHFVFVPGDELVALYRTADVVVYPYRAITTSGALASGLALGKAIITSDLPVFRELLTDRETALLVTPQDSDALASALLELLQDAALRGRLEANVRAMNFGDASWIDIAQKTLETYRSVLSHAG